MPYVAMISETFWDNQQAKVIYKVTKLQRLNGDGRQILPFKIQSGPYK
jgi:hypothetical protein